MNGFPSPLDSAFTRTRWVDDRGDGSGGGGGSSSNRFYLPSPAPFYQRTFGSGTAMGSPAAAAAASVPALLPPPAPTTSQQKNAGKKLLTLSTAPTPDIDVSAVVPPVTVVIEGRSICQRVHLHKHTGYDGLAAALRRMFVDAEDDDGGEGSSSGNGGGLDLSNAVPGYVVAYEDMEDDLLLAGDLNWKDFVRVAKRIRLLPAKSNRRRPAQEQHHHQQQPPPQTPRQSSQ